MTDMIISTPAMKAGKRHAAGRKFPVRIEAILRNPNSTAAEDMHALQELCVYYYPAYAKAQSISVDDLSGLPFELYKPMDLTAMNFVAVGEWLMQLSKGMKYARPEHGPSLAEVSWIFSVITKRMQLLKQAVEETKKA